MEEGKRPEQPQGGRGILGRLRTKGQGDKRGWRCRSSSVCCSSVCCSLGSRGGLHQARPRCSCTAAVPGPALSPEPPTPGDTVQM